MMEIEPLERGAGFEFTERVVGGAVPRQFHSVGGKRHRSQLPKGVLAGYPWLILRVTLVDARRIPSTPRTWPSKPQVPWPFATRRMSRPSPFSSDRQSGDHGRPMIRSAQC
jgi:hypothetical protein